MRRVEGAEAGLAYTATVIDMLVEMFFEMLNLAAVLV